MHEQKLCCRLVHTPTEALDTEMVLVKDKITGEFAVASVLPGSLCEMVRSEQ